MKNLNVLDHEHYFSMTDSIVRGDIPAALVEYNTILQQGFDGHLFVSGLARHFRDLLVSQDPRTLTLVGGERGTYRTLWRAGPTQWTANCS